MDMRALKAQAMKFCLFMATTYNTFESRTLPLDHGKVKDFLSKVPEDSVIMPSSACQSASTGVGRCLGGGRKQFDDMTDE